MKTLTLSASAATIDAGVLRAAPGTGEVRAPAAPGATDHELREALRRSGMIATARCTRVSVGRQDLQCTVVRTEGRIDGSAPFPAYGHPLLI
jgi:hypothetical protein